MKTILYKLFLLLLLLSSTISLSSCASSILMPYSSDLGCRKDPESGYCGSVSQVYKQSFVDQGKIQNQ